MALACPHLSLQPISGLFLKGGPEGALSTQPLSRDSICFLAPFLLSPLHPSASLNTMNAYKKVSADEVTKSGTSALYSCAQVN